MLKRYKWSRERSLDYSKVFPPVDVSEIEFTLIREYCEHLLANYDITASLEVVSTKLQSSFVVHRKGESAIFFDLSQQTIINDVIDCIQNGDNFEGVASILFKSGALYVSDLPGSYERYSRKIILDDPDNYYYINDTYTLDGFKRTMSEISVLFNKNTGKIMCELFIIAHEVFHILFKKEEYKNVNGDLAQEVFDYALEQCCYENSPNFRDIVTYYGQISISESELEGIKLDLKNRRQYYLGRMGMFKEEFECDIFAFKETMKYIRLRFPQYNSNEHTEGFSIVYYLIFCIYDLHMAMNKRALLSLKNGINHMKQDDIADMHFRKTAMPYHMYNTIYQPIIRSGILDQNVYTQYFLNYRTRIWESKKAFDGLYAFPVTRSIKYLLEKIEEDSST